MIKKWDNVVKTIVDSVTQVKELYPEDIQNHIYTIYNTLKLDLTSTYKSIPFQEYDNTLLLAYDNKVIFELGIVNTDDGASIYCTNHLNGQEVTITNLNIRSLQQTCNDFRSFVQYAAYEASLWVDAKTTPVQSYPIDDDPTITYISEFIDGINSDDITIATEASKFLFNTAVNIVSAVGYYTVETYSDMYVWKNGDTEITLYNYLPFTPIRGGALGLIIAHKHVYTGMVGLYNPQTNSESITLFMDTLKSYLPTLQIDRIRSISNVLPPEFKNMSNSNILDLLTIIMNASFVINKMNS